LENLLARRWDELWRDQRATVGYGINGGPPTTSWKVLPVIAVNKQGTELPTALGAKYRQRGDVKAVGRLWPELDNQARLLERVLEVA
jgi:lipopolysaccharide biosynthesis regulator YciM